MSRLETFFHGADTQLGVFYPQGCILVTLPDYAAALHARRHLVTNGYSDEDVIAVSGPEALEFADEFAHKHGLFSRFMTQVSRIFDTEAPYADHDLKMARKGAGFLAIHASTDHEKSAAWALIEPLSPVAARYYATAGVEHLAGEY